MRESTTGLVDGAGAVAAAYAYGDFGETEAAVGADFDNAFLPGALAGVWQNGQRSRQSLRRSERSER